MFHINIGLQYCNEVAVIWSIHFFNKRSLWKDWARNKEPRLISGTFNINIINLSLTLFPVYCILSFLSKHESFLKLSKLLCEVYSSTLSSYFKLPNFWGTTLLFFKPWKFIHEDWMISANTKFSNPIENFFVMLTPNYQKKII